MKIEEYIEQLKCDESISSYIDMDKNKEIHYVESHKHEFQKTIESIPSSPEPLKILDIGPTPFTMFIKEKFQHYDVWALDLTNLMEERFKNAGIQLKTCDLDNCSLPFEDEYFDIVIFTEVLEHIFSPPTDVLTEIKRIIRPSGKLILSVPNIARLSNRIKLLFGMTPLVNGDDQMKKGWVHGHGHIHEYTKKEILSLCKSLNFNISRVQMLSICPLDRVHIDKRINLTRFLYDCIVYFVPQFRTCIHIECRK